VLHGILGVVGLVHNLSAIDDLWRLVIQTIERSAGHRRLRQAPHGLTTLLLRPWQSKASANPTPSALQTDKALAPRASDANLPEQTFDATTGIMRTLCTTLTFAVLAGSASVLSAAEISGKVKLNGTPPPEASMKMTDPICGKERGNEMISSRHYIVGADKGLGNVLVYIKEGAAPKAPTGEAPVLDQIKCEYSPYVMAVQTGQKFKVRNSDPTLHNVNAQPKINKGFNGKGLRQTRGFRAVQVRCASVDVRLHGRDRSPLLCRHGQGRELQDHRRAGRQVRG
jgi:hypothetical protein